MLATWTALIAAALVVTATSACTTEDTNPVGTWVFQGKTGPGNCLAVGSPGGSTLVVEDANGDYVIQPQAGTSATGLVECNAKGCGLSAAETSLATAMTIVWSLQLEGRDITGSGDMMGNNPVCEQTVVDVRGTLQ
jgi:hypothetical protein